MDIKQVNKIIMLFGTFDHLHKGHLHFINESTQLGEKLIIVIARDKNVQNIKKKTPLQNEKERLNSVQKTFTSAKVTLGNLNDFYQPIRDFNPQIITLGYDQKADLTDLNKSFPQIKIIRISAFKPEKYKSSLLNQ